MVPGEKPGGTRVAHGTQRFGGGWFRSGAVRAEAFAALQTQFLIDFKDMPREAPGIEIVHEGIRIQLL